MARRKVDSEALKNKSITVLIFADRPSILGSTVTQQARELDLKWVTARYVDMGNGNIQTRITLCRRTGRSIQRRMETLDSADRSIDNLLVYLKCEIDLDHRIELRSESSAAAGESMGQLVSLLK